MLIFKPLYLESLDKQIKLNSRKKTILIAPLNWGLGHATRCIPIIQALLDHDYNPIIASDGNALEILRQEFPQVKSLELPSYEIEYPKNGKFFRWKLVMNMPKILKAINREKKMVAKWIETHEIDGVISDNRLGVYTQKVPSVYLTHQLNVLSGNTTWFSSKMHQSILKKYSECWIPDIEETPNFTGKMGHLEKNCFTLKYLGSLSRMQKKSVPKKYDLMIILSGPEPQRGLLEIKLRKEILDYKGSVIFINGIVEKAQKKEQTGNNIFYNFMNTRQLEHTFNESEIVLCRSGYTTIMDLVKLEKKAFFIPTPGQYEQEYLAEKLEKEGIAPYTTQDDFKMKDLFVVQQYKGFSEIKNTINWANLFEVFEN